MTVQSPALNNRRTNKKTRLTVRFTDSLAKWMITLGGIGAIAAVSLVCLFLVWMVIPLFLPAKVEKAKTSAVPAAFSAVARMGVSEGGNLLWALKNHGQLDVVSLDSGKVVSSQELFAPRKVTAVSSPNGEGFVAVGFDDGAIQIGSIRFQTGFLNLSEVPPSVQRLKSGEKTQLEQGSVERISEEQFRLESVVAQFEPAIASHGSAVVLIDYVEGLNGPITCVLHADGSLNLEQVRRQKNMLTKQVILKASATRLPFDLEPNDSPAHLLIGAAGASVLMAWDDGRLLRFDTRNPSSPRLAESLDLVEEEHAQLTSLAFMVGRATVLAGDSQGRVRAWFGAKPPSAGTIDGMTLVAGHELHVSKSPIAKLAVSDRARLAAAADGQGRIALFNVTNERQILSVKLEEDGESIGSLAIAPKNDGMIAFSDKRLVKWQFDPRHHETSLEALFFPLWYEGASKPEHVWQSSSGTDAYEAKFGMMPLVLGTLKATFYSLLFGAPLALLAAIYTSEFLHPRLKGRIKPTIELMASLPSVVLGFMAALVFAPVVERVLPAILAAFVTVPLTFVLGGYLWQLLPQELGLAVQRRRFGLVLLLMPVGVLAAVWVGPIVESLLFAGDLSLWLDGQKGSALGGWLLLTAPLAALAAIAFSITLAGPWVRMQTSAMGRFASGLADLANISLCLSIAALVSFAMSAAFTALGWDLRGSFVDTYVQRNALVVGFVMGFAIIPIIYTIAEDALSTVPEHLRSASLAAGATPWQTAARIVIPTAMSGLFSALIIGLGRAVGETMIVLMAAGNTPIMDFNIFNGFRTLSANIAVELPEAVRNSTHYRTLFLAALVLFAMTSVLNTAAEMVRLRFRKRAAQL